MLTATTTSEGVKLRRFEKPKVAPMPDAGSTPPLPGAVYDAISGVWRLGAFIVPTRKTSTRVPIRADKAVLSAAQRRIRAMSRHGDAKAVTGALRRQNRALQMNVEERLELALAMALLETGIDPHDAMESNHNFCNSGEKS